MCVYVCLFLLSKYSAMYWVVTVPLSVWTVFMIGDMNVDDLDFFLCMKVMTRRLRSL